MYRHSYHISKLTTLGCVLIKLATLFALLGVIVGIVLSASADTQGRAPEASAIAGGSVGQRLTPESSPTVKLEVGSIRFDPVDQGKNAVSVQVDNLSDQPQTFGIHIQTASVAGWGAQFFDTLAPGEHKSCRFAYSFITKPDATSWVRLRFYNPPSVEGWRFDDWFLEVKRLGWSLQVRQSDATPMRPAPADLSEAVGRQFRRMQELVRKEQYEKVWKLFTLADRQAGFNGSLNSFEDSMHRECPASSWSRADFLRLEPISVRLRGELVVLTARCGEAVWTLDFAPEGGAWQLDWIAGYVPPVLRWINWEERLLPQLEKRTTAHFDIYYAKGSTAERDIETIAQDKERGYEEVRDFLGCPEAPRILLVFFEDQATKLKETGHQGVGMASGTTIVEVYNRDQHLDPFHETTHILARSLGDPPALFTEGFAVYMSERLGAPPLEDLGGGQLAVYERATQLSNQGNWISLEELLTYTDIGSTESRPEVSYAEAGAFVKFLIDTYGKAKFLQAYAALQNSDQAEIQQQNLATLDGIYGRSLPALDLEWHAAMQGTLAQ